MLGIVIQLLISWLILWLFEKGNLKVLGLWPTKRRLIYFLLFFGVTAGCCITGYLLKMAFFNQRWMLNPHVTFSLVLSGLWWNLKSVLFEELLFRGVLLYVVIKKIGQVKGGVLSAVAFGLYHWFSQNAFGNIMNMGFLFLFTGLFGLVLAYAYAKTGSLYFPVAVHFGWNSMQQILFSDSPVGQFIMIPVAPQPQTTVSYFIFFMVLSLPLLMAPLVNYWLLKRMTKPVLKKPNGLAEHTNAAS